MRSDMVVEGLALLRRALDTLAEADLGAESLDDQCAVLEELEIGRRRALAIGAAVAGKWVDLDRAALSDTPRKLLADVVRISPAAAGRRLNHAQLLAARRTLTGEPLDPHLPATAAAWRDGLVDEDHVKVIAGFFDDLAADTPVEVVVDAERFLADKAAQLRPDQLAKLAARLAVTINPDGVFSEQDRARKSGFSWAPQRRDGMSKGIVWATPEQRALLDAFFAKFAQPGMCLPDDPDPLNTSSPAHPEPADTQARENETSEKDASDSAVGEKETGDTAAGDPGDSAAARSDARAPKQRRHDALSALLKAILGNPALGTRHGLPVTVVVTMSLDQLTSAAGGAVTATGTWIPIPDLIRLAAGAQPYLAVFDDHKNRALYLAKANRCVTADQWLMLLARDRGCTKPGCDQPADRCQAHHTKPWAHFKRTDINEMTLACYDDHQQINTDGWSTTIATDGTVHWTPPPHYPRNTPTTNDFHHPERHRPNPRKPDNDDDEIP